MAWTSPKTWVATSVLTAAQLNTHLRDNLLELAPSKASLPSSYFTTSATNQITERFADVAKVATSQTTTSTAFTDLATTGPAVTVTTGTAAFIFTSCKIANSGLNSSLADWDISGAMVRSAQDQTAITKHSGVTGGDFWRMSQVDHHQTLTAGTNTFTMKYRVSAGTGTFADRIIAVFPL